MSYVSDAPRGADLRLFPGRQRTPATLEFAAKRAFDVVAATALLLILSPLMLLVGIAIKLGSPGPVFSRRHCWRLGGKPMAIYAFRTRSLSARSDEQPSRFGAMLHSTGIDRLPQLINILRGEMSFVGLSLEVVTGDDEQSRQIASYAFRYRIKPGMVGLTRANAVPAHEPMPTGQSSHLDLWYINNWSLALDLRILMRACLQPRA